MIILKICLRVIKIKDKLRDLRHKQMIKSKEPIQRRLQIYNNNLVDEKINQSYNTRTINNNAFSQPTIFTTIFNLNHPDTVRSFKKILNSPYTSNDPVFKNLVRISADKTTKVIAEKETERILKNLKYVEKTLTQAKLDINVYNNAINKLSPVTSRYNILEKSLTEGKMYNGRELSYKEANNLSKNLENYKQNKISYEEAKAVNNESIKNELDKPYTHKTWIWSGLENTRHSGMDGTTVPINEKFVVYNEVNGDVDYLDFPGDVENYSNPSNVINCQCSVDFIYQEGSESETKSDEGFELLDFKSNRHRF